MMDSLILALLLDPAVAAVPPVNPHSAVEATRSTAPMDVVREPRNAIAFRLENDVVSGSDSNYSSGLELSWLRNGRGPMDRVWDWFGLSGGQYVTGYEIGQLIVTPRVITTAVPDPADRPYAGLAFISLSTQRVEGNRLDGMKLIVGVAGPASGAAEIQRWFHLHTGGPVPQGWDSQLKNEPILNLVYEHRRRWRLNRSDRAWGTDIVPSIGGMLGNVLVQGKAGSRLRFGFNLPDDFGTTQVRGLGALPHSRRSQANRSFGIYGFVGGNADLVARNLTLDGNTFRDGPSVDKHAVYWGGKVGVAVWVRSVEVTFAYVAWSPEYVAQTGWSRFGTASVTVLF
jgi:hypothetical protein